MAADDGGGETWWLDADPDPADSASIVDRLVRDNLAHAQPERYEPLSIVARSADGSFVGGINAFTSFGWLRLTQLFVEPDHRGKGHGRRLVEAMEQAGAARGCTHVLVDTFSFQAPWLYERAGYREVLTLDGYPDGHRWHHYLKELG